MDISPIETEDSNEVTDSANDVTDSKKTDPVEEESQDHPTSGKCVHTKLFSLQSHIESERYRCLYHDLQNTIDRLWFHESESEAARMRNQISPAILTKSEAHCLKIMDETLKYHKEGKYYECGLLWKEDVDYKKIPLNLPDASFF